MINLYENIKCRRVNQKQKNILYAAMAANRQILEYGSGSDVRRARKAVWKRVTLELNMAGPEKDTSQWRKVWTDLRLGMRKKWDKALKSEYILTEYERRVIAACGMIEKAGDEDTYSDENSVEDINNFLAYLQEDRIIDAETFQEHSNYLSDESSESNTQNTHYLADSTEFIICQPTDVNVKDEFDEEQNNFEDYQEPSVECISDDEDQKTNTFVEFREPSVECISDEEESMITNNVQGESTPHNMSYEEPFEREIQEQKKQSQSPEMPPVPSSSLSNNTNLPRRKKLQNSTLKEIRKMHRDLLRESKKQTALLRKLVMQK